MEVKRRELMPGVWLSHIRTDKFKTACMSLNLLAPLKRESAAMNALIPYVLRRGCTAFPDMEALAARLEELYGTVIEPQVRQVGEIQCPGFFVSLPEGDFLPQGEDLLKSVCALLGQLLLSPVTRGGLFLPQVVDSEREKALERIRARLNDKRAYANYRCLEEMCCCEDYAVGRYGSEADCAAIRYQKLSKHYRALLQSAPVEIIYCGRSPLPAVAEALGEALLGLPRGELYEELGTDVRMNALEAQPRFLEERLAVSQGRLVLGFRLGECMEEPELPELYVFNAVYGEGSASKLFMNVRERLQLCYYAASALDVNKGLMLAFAGVAFDKREAAQNEMLAQLAAMARGEISDEELQSARAAVASDCRMLCDSQYALEGFYFTHALDGLDCAPEELAELAENVDREAVARIAAGLECDMVYFLRGEDGAAGDDEEED